MRTLVALAALVVLPLAAMGQGTPSPAGATAFFVSPADGAEVTSPVTLIFSVTGMDAAADGAGGQNGWHLHVLFDRPPFGEGARGAAELTTLIDLNENAQTIPEGRTEVKIQIGPGRHTLQLVLGDRQHLPHVPPVVSAPITIIVK